MENKFITTTDSNVAEQLKKSGYMLLQNNNGIFVFMNNPTIVFADTNIDYKKIMFTNVMAI